MYQKWNETHALISHFVHISLLLILFIKAKKRGLKLPAAKFECKILKPTCSVQLFIKSDAKHHMACQSYMAKTQVKRRLISDSLETFLHHILVKMMNTDFGEQ